MFPFSRKGLALCISFHTSTPRIGDTNFRNLQVVKRQQVEEFVRRLIFPISQAAVAVSEQSSSYINYFSKFYFRGFP